MLILWWGVMVFSYCYNGGGNGFLWIVIVGELLFVIKMWFDIFYNKVDYFIKVKVCIFVDLYFFGFVLKNEVICFVLLVIWLCFYFGFILNIYFEV